MSLLVTNVEGVTLKPGDQIAAFDAEGRLTGVGDVSGGMVGLAVWGGDGLAEGAVFELRLWQESSGLESPLKLTETPVYSTDGWLISGAQMLATTPTTPNLTLAPNPFNGMTSIRFALPSADKVTLAVVDLTGREVARLVDGELAAGVHEAVWRADAAPTGVYLIRLAAGSEVRTTKAMLVR